MHETSMWKVKGVISLRAAMESGDPNTAHAVEAFHRQYLGVPRLDETTEQAWQDYAGIICRRGKRIIIPAWLQDGSAPESVAPPDYYVSLYSSYEGPNDQAR